MKGKQIIAVLLMAALAAGMNTTTASAASKKKITTVNLTVSADIVLGGTVSDQQAEVTVKGSKIEVGEYQFVNDGFQWYETDIPRLEVTLYSDEDYYFSTTDDSFTVNGGTYVKQKKEDYSQTLTVTIDLPPAGEFTQAIGLAQWNEYKAGWSPSIGAGSYELKLYRDGKSVGTVKTTNETSMDLKSVLTKEGNYTFRVRPVNAKNPEKKGDWVESSSQFIDQEKARFNASSDGGSWKQDATGWWYENEDGSYIKNNWLNISGVWYFFDERG